METSRHPPQRPALSADHRRTTSCWLVVMSLGLLLTVAAAPASAHYLSMPSIRKIAENNTGLGHTVRWCRRVDRHQIDCQFTNDEEGSGAAPFRQYTLRGRALFQRDDVGSGHRIRATFDRRASGANAQGGAVALGLVARAQEGSFRVASFWEIGSSVRLTCSSGTPADGYLLLAGGRDVRVDASGRFRARRVQPAHISDGELVDGEVIDVSGRTRGPRISGQLRLQVQRWNGTTCDSGRIAFGARARFPPPYIAGSPAFAGAARAEAAADGRFGGPLRRRSFSR